MPISLFKTVCGDRQHGLCAYKSICFLLLKLSLMTSFCRDSTIPVKELHHNLIKALPLHYITHMAAGSHLYHTTAAALGFTKCSAPET